MNYDGLSPGDSQDSKSESGVGVLLIDADIAPTIVIPGGAWLLKADFVRQGSDLLLTAPDGHQVVVRGFFNLQTPPNLMTEGGALISADLAAKLAGPLAPGQFAQAAQGATDAPAAVTEPIGKVVTADGKVEATRVDGSKVTLAEGDPVYQGDILETGKDGAVGIEFIDQSTFSLGDGGRMVLDEMIYDPGAGEGSFKVSLVQGAFSFISGNVAKIAPDSMSVTTPVATIGIRGTTVAGRAGAEGEDNQFTLLADAGGGTGEIVITNAAGTMVLNIAGATVQISSFNQAPPPPTIMTPTQIAQQYSAVLATLPPSPAAEEGTEQQGQNDINVLQALAETNEQINRAIEDGRQQFESFQVQIVQVRALLKEILAPQLPVIDIVALKAFFASNDYSALTARLGAVVKAATAAENSAAAAEASAATKTSALVNGIVVKAAAAGMTTTEAANLASVITAPLKALGTAASFAASASSTAEAAKAAMAAAAKGEAVSEALIAQYEAFVSDTGTGSIKLAVAKIAKIVAASITASDKIVTASIAAAKTAKAEGKSAADIATAAKTLAAQQYNTEVSAALAALQVGEANPVSLTDLSELVNDITTHVRLIKTTAAEGGSSEAFLAMQSAMGFAETAAQKADETAEHAENTIGATDFNQMLSFASLALATATEAETARKGADGVVDLGKLGTGIDASAFDEFLSFIGFTPGQSEADSEDAAADDTVVTAEQAIAALNAALNSLAAAQEFIDGTAQTAVTTATAAATAAATASAAAVTAANAAAAAVLDARTVLIDKLVNEAITAARLQVFNDAAAKATQLVADTNAEVQTASAARDAAQTAADNAQALADAAPSNAVLAADAVLKKVLLANAEAALSFDQQVLNLFKAAETTAKASAQTAQTAADAAATLADAAQTDVDNLSATAAGKLAESIAATETSANAQATLSAAKGVLSVAQAGAEAQAEAALDIAVESAIEATAAAEAAAALAEAKAAEAISWARRRSPPPRRPATPPIWPPMRRPMRKTPPPSITPVKRPTRSPRAPSPSSRPRRRRPRRRRRRPRRKPRRRWRRRLPTSPIWSIRMRRRAAIRCLRRSNICATPTPARTAPTPTPRPKPRRRC